MKKIISLILVILICCIAFLPTYSLAFSNSELESYRDIYKKDSNNNDLVSAGEKILAVAQVIGVASAVICLTILGVKYMILSTDASDKANIKEKLIPFLIGAVLLFGGSGLLGLIAKFAYGLKA